MKVIGFIAINVDTFQVLVPEELEHSHYGWLFDSLDALTEYAETVCIKLEDYVIHAVTDDTYTFCVRTQKDD